MIASAIVDPTFLFVNTLTFLYIIFIGDYTPYFIIDLIGKKKQIF